MVKVIKAEECYVEAIGKLWLEFITFHADIDPVFTPPDNPIQDFTENRLRRFMSSEDGLVLVALDGMRPVGFATCEIRRNTPGLKRKKHGIIENFAVTSDHRRKGVGEKMFAAIAKWFKLKDIDRIELGTATQNKLANSFWKKQGFTIYRYFLCKEI